MPFRFTPACCCRNTPSELTPCIPDCGVIFAGITTEQTPTLVETYQNTQKWTLGFCNLNIVSTANECTGGCYFDFDTNTRVKYIQTRKQITANMINFGNCWCYQQLYYCGKLEEERRAMQYPTRYDCDTDVDVPLTVLIPTTFDPGVTYLYGANHKWYEEYRLPFKYEQYPFKFILGEREQVKLPSISSAPSGYFKTPADCGIAQKSKAKEEVWIPANQLEATVNQIASNAQNGMDHLDIINIYLEGGESQNRRSDEDYKASVVDVQFKSSSTNIGFYRDADDNVSTFFSEKADYNKTVGCIKTVHSSSVIPSGWDGDASNMVGTPRGILNHASSDAEAAIEFSDGDNIPDKWNILGAPGTLSQRFSGYFNILAGVKNAGCSDLWRNSYRLQNIPRYHVALFSVPKDDGSWGDTTVGESTPAKVATMSISSLNFDEDRIFVYSNTDHIINNQKWYSPGGRSIISTGGSEYPVAHCYWIASEPYGSGTMYKGTPLGADRPITPIYTYYNNWPSISLWNFKDGKYKYVTKASLGAVGCGTDQGVVNTFSGSAYHRYINAGGSHFILPTFTESDLRKLLTFQIYTFRPSTSSFSQYDELYCMLDLGVSLLTVQTLPESL